MTIREATFDDGPRIEEMAARFLASTAYGQLFDVTPEFLEDVVGRAFDQGVILVAEVDGARLVGLIALTIARPRTQRPFAEEIAWWVEPEYRNGIIGPKLLLAAEQWARNKLCASIKMVAPVGGTTGVYYERLGYRPIETAYFKAL